MVDNEGLGFHIKGSAPVIIYATDPGSPAARAGVVPGSCIVEVSVCEYVCMHAFVVSTGPVAQWIRHLTTNQGIPGSNPGRVEIFLNVHTYIHTFSIYMLLFSMYISSVFF